MLAAHGISDHGAMSFSVSSAHPYPDTESMHQDAQRDHTIAAGRMQDGDTSRPGDFALRQGIQATLQHRGRQGDINDLPRHTGMAYT